MEATDLLRGALRMRLGLARCPRTVRYAVRLMYLGALAQLGALVIILVNWGNIEVAGRALAIRALGPHPAPAAEQHLLANVSATIGAELTADITITLFAIAAWLLLAWANGKGFPYGRSGALLACIAYSAVTAAGLSNGDLSYAPAPVIASCVAVAIGLAVNVLLVMRQSWPYYARRAVGTSAYLPFPPRVHLFPAMPLCIYMFTLGSRTRRATIDLVAVQPRCRPRLPGKRGTWDICASCPRKARRAAVADAGQLVRRAEIVAYWLAVAPLTARLPASLAYGVACWRGDRWFRHWPQKRAEVVHGLREVLGEELSEEAAERVAREVFRSVSCQVIDVMRLHGRAERLERLVEIRGREHLDAALAGGKGAILCSAHVGSYVSAFSLLHASGFPVTTIGRWWWNYRPGVSPAVRRFWDVVYARRMLRHRQRPNIEPWPGRVQVAAQAAAALRDNEVVTICSDAAPLDADLARTIVVPFLGRQARLLPGVVTLAQLTGAPVLMASVRRSADYRHQVLEISAPVPMDGDTATTFGRCAAAMDAAVRASLAEWDFWFEPDDLASLGLLSDNSHPVPALP